MVSLDQVRLLEEKVESAVAKIAQLKAENDALRTQCAELKNSLDAKSELISSFQADQTKIEEGIIKALARLNAVENYVLQDADSQPASPAASPDGSAGAEAQASADAQLQQEARAQAEQQALMESVVAPQEDAGSFHQQEVQSQPVMPAATVQVVVQAPAGATVTTVPSESPAIPSEEGFQDPAQENPAYHHPEQDFEGQDFIPAGQDSPFQPEAEGGQTVVPPAEGDGRNLFDIF